MLGIISESREALTQRLRDPFERRKTVVVEVLFAQIVPNMPDGIEFGAVGWLGDQMDILWNNQIIRPVLASPIHLHDDEVRERKRG